MWVESICVFLMKCGVYQTLALSRYLFILFSHVETMLGRLGIHNTEKKMQYICLYVGVEWSGTVNNHNTGNHGPPVTDAQLMESLLPAQFEEFTEL